MRKAKATTISLLFLFLLSAFGTIMVTQVHSTRVVSSETVINTQVIVDSNSDKIDDKLVAQIEESFVTSTEAVVVFDHTITSVDRLKLANLGVILSSETWDLGRRIKVTTSSDNLNKIADFVDVKMIVAAEIRSIMVAIEGEDFSNLHAIEENFEDCDIFWEIGVALIRDYSGIENDINRLGTFSAIEDTTDVRLHYDYTKPDNTDITTNTQQTIEQIGADEMWDLGYTGSGIKVGVIDSGINDAHVDFSGRVSSAQSFVTVANGYSLDDPSTSDYDDGHGTHVSGIIAGDGTFVADNIGVAPDCYIYFGKVGTPGTDGTIAGLTAAANWLRSKGVKVINLSMGFTPDDVGSNILESAFRNLVRNYGITICTSAGNDGDQGFYTVGSPGNDDIITVGVVDNTDQPMSMVYWSAKGLNGDDHMKPDVLAPGIDITSLGMGSTTAYNTLMGTSMASPHVAGAAALLIQACNDEGISANPGVIKSALMKTASPFTTADLLLQGRGIINVKAAWDYIETASLNGTVPEIGACNPVQQPLSLWSTLLQGQVSEQYLTCVTPFANGLSLEATGDAADFVEIGEFTGKYSYVSKITYTIPVDTEPGEYTGTITFKHSANVLDTVDIVVNVVKSSGNRMLLNFRTTDWSQDHMYGQYREFTADILANGWVISEQNIELDSTILANYEAVWFPDPFDLDYPLGYKEDFSTIETYNPLSEDEIYALHDFVANGGSVFFCFNGEMWDDEYSIIYGTNVSEVNRFTEVYGITVTDDHWPYSGTQIYDTTITHPLTAGVSAIDHYGAYITVDEKAVLLTEKSEGSIYGNLAYNETSTGGRVVVMSTNFVLDSDGYLNKYNFGGTQNDQFGRNLVRWTTAQHRFKQQSYTVSGYTLNMIYEYVNGPGPDFGGYVLTPTEKRDNLTWVEISPNVWNCTYYFTEFGEHQVWVECGPTGWDEFDYFVVSASETTKTGGLWFSITLLISFFGLSTWLLIHRRKK